MSPETEYENVHVHKLVTDERATSFIIWVKEGVKAHKHEKHSETLYVLEGEAEMQMDGKPFTVKAGDFIHIPMGVVHSVQVTSGPVKVLSVQAPEFLGKDRIWVEE